MYRQQGRLEEVGEARTAWSETWNSGRRAKAWLALVCLWPIAIGVAIDSVHASGFKLGTIVTMILLGGVACVSFLESATEAGW